ncbi:MAG: hypothetical protein WBX11_00955 [Thiobacillaceae bacterium]
MHGLKTLNKLNKDASGGHAGSPAKRNSKPYRVHVTNRFKDEKSYTLGPYATKEEAIEAAKKVTVDFLKDGIRTDGQDTPLDLLDYFLERGDYAQVIGPNYRVEFNTAGFAEKTCYEVLGVPVPERLFYSKVKFIPGYD